MIADDIADLLTSGGISGSIVFVGELPEHPHTALGILPTGGAGPTRTMQTGQGNAPLEEVRVQVRARSTDHQTAEGLLYNAHVQLNVLAERLINARRYYFAEPLQAPFYLALDDANRTIFACNYRILRAEATG